MRIGAFFSAAFHIAIIALAMTTFATGGRFNVELPPNIPVEILEISDVTNISAAVEAEPEDIVEEIIEEVVPEVTPQAVAEPEPEPVADIVEPEFSPFEEPEAEVAEVEPEPTPPPPAARPRPRPQPAPRREENFLADLDLDALIDRTPREQQETVVDPTAAIGDETQVEVAERSRSAVGLGTGLTISEMDALNSVISDCWNIPAGARDAENLRIELRVFFARDGSVQRTEILNRARYNSDTFYRAATDSAVRAVERCENGTNYDGSPRRGYNLPRDRYEDWRSVRLTFDPSQAL